MSVYEEVLHRPGESREGEHLALLDRPRKPISAYLSADTVGEIVVLDWGYSE